MGDLEEHLIKKLQELWDGLKELKDRSEVDDALPQVLWRKEIVAGLSEDVYTLFMCCITELYRLWSPDFPYNNPRQLTLICSLYQRTLVKFVTARIDEHEKQLYIIENLARTPGYFNSCLKFDVCIEIFEKILKQIFYCVSENFQLKLLQELAVNLVSVASDPYVPVPLLNIILENLSSLDNNITSDIEKFGFANMLLASRIEVFKSSLYSIFFDYFIIGIRKDNFQYYGNWHEILYNMSLYNYEVIMDIFPLIEKKLSSIKESERLDAVNFFGKIFQLNLRFPSHFKQIWSSFLERFFDKKKISLVCISMASDIIFCHHELTEDLLDVLMRVGNMSSQEIRYQVIRSMCMVATKHPLFMAGHKKFWLILKEKADEKEDIIRNITLRCLAHIYNILISETLLLNETIENVTWAGHKILSSYLIAGKENKFQIVRLVFQKLVPYKLSIPQRMERLLKLLIPAPEIAFQAFRKMLVDQYRLRRTVSQWFSVMKSNEDEENVIKLLSLMFGVECNALTEVSKYLSTNENYLIYVMDLINPLKSHETRIAIASDLLDQESDVTITLRIIIEWLAYIIDREALKILMMNIEMLSHNDESNDDRSLKLLKIFAEVLPELFFNQELLSYLASFLQLKSPAIFTAFTRLSRHSEVREMFVDIAEDHDLFILCLDSLNSCSSKVVKASCCFVLAYFGHYKENIYQYYKIILDNLQSESVTAVTRGLTALGHMILKFSDISLTRKCIYKVKDMILLDIEETSFTGSTLCTKEELPVHTIFKLEAVKTFVRLILSLNEELEVKENLIFLIYHQNDILKHEYSSEAEQHWISVTIFSSILKLLFYYPFQELLSLCLKNLYSSLSRNTETYIFLKKLSKYLLKGLSPDFIGLFCLAVPKKDKELKRKSFNLLCMVLEKKKMEIKEVEADDNSEHWIVTSLAVICESLILEDLDRKGREACIRFILKPILPLKMPFSYYNNIIDEAKIRISSVRKKETDELKKIIRQTIERTKK